MEGVKKERETGCGVGARGREGRKWIGWPCKGLLRGRLHHWSSRFAAFHSEPWEQGERVIQSLLALAIPTSHPQPTAHQVEVGEDAGRPVLLGHEQQHLVVDEVAVLLERASQTQLQGLADLQAGG